MFNLLVSGSDVAWEAEQRMSMDRARFREYSGDESVDLSPETPASLRVLESAQTLLMYELSVKAPHAESVRIGRLRDIRVEAGRISFRFDETGRIPRATVHRLAHRLQIAGFETNRTHWAVKDGGIPQDVLREVTPTAPMYDVVLSFAGEDRTFVDRVARLLDEQGVRVFYDTFEPAALWGKNLVEHFDDIYRKRGRYCVMFVSQHYVSKMWTTHERRAALDRALAQRTEYVLPARFDDTDVPGLSPSVAYQDLRRVGPDELATLVLQKLGRTHRAS